MINVKEWYYVAYAVFKYPNNLSSILGGPTTLETHPPANGLFGPWSSRPRSQNKRRGRGLKPERALHTYE